MTSLRKWLQEKALVAAVSVALVVSSTAGASGICAPVDVKQVESALIAVQGQIVSGRLDDGLDGLKAVHSKAVTTDLADRVAFVALLAEVRVAEKVGDTAKLVAALNEAFKQAKQPDQVQAVWAVGVSVANGMIANKDCGASQVVDFLTRGPAASMKQFSTCIEIVRLRIATGNVGTAEAELRTAAGYAETASDWSTWMGAVNQLASTVGSQTPQAGADVISRLREVAKPVAAGMDIAQGRYLLSRGIVDGVEALIEQAVMNATTDADLLGALSLQFDVAISLHRSGKIEQAQLAVEKAENLATACQACAAQANVRGNAFLTLGQPSKAAEIFWAASQTVQTVQERDQMLVSFGAAMVAAGDSADVAARLRAGEATPAVFVNVASAMVRAGDSIGALRLLGTVPPQAFVNDTQAVANIGPLMQQIQAQRQQIAQTQGERVRAIATAFDAAAKATTDAKAAEALNAQAAAMTALAGQVEK